MIHTFSLLVENHQGVLARIAGLFSGRGYNLESLTVGVTTDPTVSRITLVCIGDDATMEQIKKLADGRVYTAEQAIEGKLIDKIGYLDDAIDIVKKKAGIRKARVVIYHRPFSYKNNIYSKMISPDIKTINLFNIDLGALTGTAGLSFMYLWLP